MSDREYSSFLFQMFVYILNDKNDPIAGSIESVVLVTTLLVTSENKYSIVRQ